MPKYISIDKAVELLKNGKVIALPTETVYGLAGVASNEKAIKKIYSIKNRPKDNPLICHFYGVKQIKEWGLELNEQEKKILEKFSPGPISLKLQLPKDSKLKIATAGLTSVIVRIPSNKIFKEVIKKTNMPLAAPSANTSGKFSATNAQMVYDDLGKKVDGIIDGGTCKFGLESTIIDASNPKLILILRPGPIGKKEIEGLFKNKIKVEHSKKKTQTPGSKYKHYSPDAELIWLREFSKLDFSIKTKLLLTKEDKLKWEKSKYFNSQISIEVLGSKEDSKKISKKIYQLFYQLDKEQFQRAYISKLNTNNASGSANALVERISKAINKE